VFHDQTEYQRAASAEREASHSVGSLPGPASSDAFTLAAAPALAGHWRQALRAERRLGVLLWIGLALVIVLVSSR
jgi:hypothetical protein